MQAIGATNSKRAATKLSDYLADCSQLERDGRLIRSLSSGCSPAPPSRNPSFNLNSPLVQLATTSLGQAPKFVIVVTTSCEWFAPCRTPVGTCTTCTYLHSFLVASINPRPSLGAHRTASGNWRPISCFPDSFLQGSRPKFTKLFPEFVCADPVLASPCAGRRGCCSAGIDGHTTSTKPFPGFGAGRIIILTLSFLFLTRSFFTRHPGLYESRPGRKRRGRVP